MFKKENEFIKLKSELTEEFNKKIEELRTELLSEILEVKENQSLLEENISKNNNIRKKSKSQKNHGFGRVKVPLYFLVSLKSNKVIDREILDYGKYKDIAEKYKGFDYDIISIGRWQAYVYIKVYDSEESDKVRGTRVVVTDRARNSLDNELDRSEVNGNAFYYDNKFFMRLDIYQHGDFMVKAFVKGENLKNWESRANLCKKNSSASYAKELDKVPTIFKWAKDNNIEPKFPEFSKFLKTSDEFKRLFDENVVFPEGRETPYTSRG